MPELIIKYKSKKTLDALINFSKYFNFSIIFPSKSPKKTTKINLDGFIIEMGIWLFVTFFNIRNLSNMLFLETCLTGLKILPFVGLLFIYLIIPLSIST